jgi:hypothetical protein
MSTHSTITAKMSNGIFKTVYCHFDGYISNNGRILYWNYQDQKKIDELLDLGNLSNLDLTLNMCNFFTRDRGEELSYSCGNTAESSLSMHGSQEFNYLWDGEEWFVDGEKLSKHFDIKPVEKDASKLTKEQWLDLKYPLNDTSLNVALRAIAEDAWDAAIKNNA